MADNHGLFYSVNGKRQVLIADDEQINRDILCGLLEQEYDVIFACDGRETITQIKQNADTLSLVLLDLMMPEINGLDVLRQVKNTLRIKNIPIIVMTADPKTEVECLMLGAADFIEKPYPQPDVILARIMRTIELSEDRMIINATEHDTLTELYNREFFYRYAEQFDAHHKHTTMDAIVIDINHFHTINERFGTDYGDKVLRWMAHCLHEIVSREGGITCHRDADTFMLYCPHGMDYAKLLETVSDEVNALVASDNRIRLRMGVYENVSRELPIERRFDRANMACDSVKTSYAGSIGIYDSSMHDQVLFHEQLIEDFHKAIAEKQFAVFYQPKFDIHLDKPVLTSAEALVRWVHPTLGLISPGVFIPLFEENGLIQELDQYVWDVTATQIHEWKTRFGVSVPVSVNVSRVDMYDPLLVATFRQIVDSHQITCSDLLLEITESAYTKESDQIIRAVNDLRELGFRIEMDDFGTGYSSLNMISSLPIDALKLDMQLIRQAFAKGGNTKLLEIIMDIADYLSVPVIAEGVETEEQLRSLKEMGCDIVQGFYFSKPVPASEFEKYFKENENVDG